MINSTENTDPKRDELATPSVLTRRAVLKLGGATGLAMTTGGTALAAGTRRRSHLRRGSYRSLVGQRFHVAGGGSLQLIDIVDLSHHERGNENAFELVFARSRHSPALRTTTPTLRHSALGSFPLFVTAGETTKSSRHYCAVINRVHG
jgi:hypothetical protein